ncbi:TIGR03943 family protein, partial [Paenibacillus sepulcri]|nr:TIGR03943 family protein [Paenibacillus sepulcri]
PEDAPSADGPQSELAKLFPADEFTEAYSKYGMELYQKPLITVTEKNYMEILTTIDLYLDNFIGKKLTMEGFVYRDETLAANQFILGRFAVQCCTADALPYGVLVNAADAGAYKNDTWLRMTGTINKTQYNGTDVILFTAGKSEKIKPSDDPYVYPDYDFGL